jgi:hypothetical protein
VSTPENFREGRNTGAAEIATFVKDRLSESLTDEMYRNREEESEGQPTNKKSEQVAKERESAQRKREHDHEDAPKKGPRFFGERGHPKRMGKRFMLKINAARIILLASFMIAIALYKKSVKKYHKVLQTKVASQPAQGASRVNFEPSVVNPYAPRTAPFTVQHPVQTHPYQATSSFNQAF